MVVRLVAVMLWAIAIIALLSWAAMRWMWRSKFQFSLRTLLIFVTAFAVLFSVITSWNYWFKAKLYFIDSTSPLVSMLKAPPQIIEEKGCFKATYRPQHIDIGEIYKLSEKISLSLTTNGSYRCSTNHTNQTMILEADNRSFLDEKLDAMRKTDVLLPGRFIIQGLVKDAEGNPVPEASVDLMGPYVFINYFMSRNDGTFAMPITAPANSGYYFSIRYGDKKMETPTFSLDSAQPELFVIIQVK